MHGSNEAENYCCDRRAGIVKRGGVLQGEDEEKDADTGLSRVVDCEIEAVQTIGMGNYPKI